MFAPDSLKSSTVSYGAFLAFVGVSMNPAPLKLTLEGGYSSAGMPYMSVKFGFSF